MGSLSLTIGRDDMWTLTLLGTVIVLILGMALRPSVSDGRRGWAMCVGVAQLVGNVRSPAWAVLVGFWSALLVDQLVGREAVPDDQLQPDDGVEG